MNERPKYHWADIGNCLPIELSRIDPLAVTAAIFEDPECPHDICTNGKATPCNTWRGGLKSGVVDIAHFLVYSVVAALTDFPH
ncbi:hypothetical protein RJT34_20359 [Clitoria ternatea]|uniref:Uncharacterized protein n=1 Tax=Clitoria ternatea TaxID=43366 RepID=A0AAN9ITA1_CLITE